MAAYRGRSTWSLGVLVSAWRRKAIELIPAQRDLIAAADSPMALWVELWWKFLDSIRTTDDSTHLAFIRYAAWCCSPESGPLPNDASTAAAVAFYEHLAAEKDLWPRFKSWFRPAQSKALEQSFRYFLSDDEFQRLNAAFYDKRTPN
jgi:hypothetical protein